MASTAFPDFPADDFDEPDEDWFIQPRDHDPASEHQRQSAFVSYMRKHAPAVIVYQVPNGGRMSAWQKIRRLHEGTVAGACDVEIKWGPPARCFVAEFKDGQKGPTREQRDMLNRLYRAGVPCGVYRTKEVLVAHLRRVGAPFLDQRRVG